VTDYLLSSTAVAILLVIFVVAFALFARRILRIAIKVALAMTLVFALLLTGGVGWWRGWFSSSKTPARQTNRTTPARPAR
jgi:cyanate permease